MIKFKYFTDPTIKINRQCKKYLHSQCISIKSLF